MTGPIVRRRRDQIEETITRVEVVIDQAEAVIARCHETLRKSKALVARIDALTQAVRPPRPPRK